MNPPVFRRALRADLPTLVHLLADDSLGAQREADIDPLPDAYWRAFDAIDADPNNELVVAVQGGDLVGMLQLTFILAQVIFWSYLVAQAPLRLIFGAAALDLRLHAV